MSEAYLTPLMCVAMGMILGFPIGWACSGILRSRRECVACGKLEPVKDGIYICPECRPKLEEVKP